EPPVDELDRPDVEPSRRLGRDEDAGVAGDLPRDDDLLLVPPGERGRRRRRPSTPDVELGEELAGARDEPPWIEPAEAGLRRVAVLVEREVLRERELEDEA